MPVKHNPPGRKLPDNHPFATPRIVFSQKLPDSSQNDPAPPDSPKAGELDIAMDVLDEFLPKKL